MLHAATRLLNESKIKMENVGRPPGLERASRNREGATHIQLESECRRQVSKAYAEVRVCLAKFVREGKRAHLRKVRKNGKNKFQNSNAETVNHRFNRCAKRTAKELLDGQASGILKATKSDVLNVYGKLWRKSKSVENPLRVEPLDDCDPVTIDELAQQLKRMKLNTSAGVDQVDPRVFKQFASKSEGRSKVLAFYNAMILTGIIPSALRRARVTLIPKKVGAESASDCRPISVHSVIYRVFTSILDARLRPLISQQVGSYQKALDAGTNACAKAACLVKGAILNETRASRSIYLASLDVSKAFDSLKHQSIHMAIMAAKLPLYMKRLLLASLKSRRVFQCSDGIVNFIASNGVPQGLSISATLFILTLDAVRKPLESGGIVLRRGRTLNSGEELCRLSGVAYCDDLLLVDSDKQVLSKRVSEVIETCKSLGLTTNESKSMYMGVTRFRNKAKTYHIDEEPLTLADGKVIKRVCTIKYLGIKLSLRHHRFCFKTALSSLVGRAVNAKLSIRNRLKLLGKYVIPRLVYQLTCFPIFGANYHRTNRSRLYSDLDSIVHKGIRKILTMNNTSLPKSFYHMPLNKGGLGLPSFEDSMPGARARLLSAFAAGEFYLVADNLFVDVAKMNSALEKEAHLEAGKRIENQKNRRIKALANLSDGTGNWLPKTKDYSTIPITSYSGSTLKCVARLRANRMGNAPHGSCRLCGSTRETLSHLVNGQECHWRIKQYWCERHDRCVSELANFLQSMKVPGNTVFVERTFRTGANSFIRPDLVVINTRNKALVVLDVHVTSADGYREDGRISARLVEMRKAKVVKYECHLSLILNQLTKDEADMAQWKVGVVPLVVSMWGVNFICSNDSVIKRVGVRSLTELLKVTTRAALRSSAKCLHKLLWDTRR